jgi:hypothetical protein
MVTSRRILVRIVLIDQSSVLLEILADSTLPDELLKDLVRIAGRAGL